MEGQFLGRGCTGLVQGLQDRCTESWAWTQNPREQNASCAPGIPVETIEAKVKPRRNQPDPAYLALGSFGSARARARTLVLKGTGTLVSKNVCAIVWPTGQWVHAPSLTPSGPRCIS